MVKTVISMKELLEAGVHFGHKVSNWNPKMKNYIFVKRRGVHVINLQKTLLLFEQAYHYVKNVTANGGKVLFVGTKKQAQKIISEHAERSGQYYINHHWIGGLLTNFSVVRQSIDKIDSIRKILDDEEARKKYIKRDLVKMEKSLKKLEESFLGVKDMKKLPDLIFVVDAYMERSAVNESNTMNIPVCAMVDTNSSPDNIQIIIPSNDDAIRSISIFVSRVADAALAGKQMIEVARQESMEVLDGAEVDLAASLPADLLPPPTAPTDSKAPRNDKERGKSKYPTKENSEDAKKAASFQAPSTPQVPPQNLKLKEAKSADPKSSKVAPPAKESSNKEPSSKKSAPKESSSKASAPKKPDAEPSSKESAPKKPSAKESAPKETTPKQSAPKEAGDSVNISAQVVKELREVTQAGFMECKSALKEANGNKEEAIRILKEKGMALAEKKSSSREAHEGLVYINKTDTQITAISFLCETDFVAKNEDFKKFTQEVGKKIVEEGEAFVKTPAYEALSSEIVTKLREKIVIGETLTIPNEANTQTGFYLHTNQKVAAFITATFTEDSANSLKSESLDVALKDLAMQVTAMNPLALSSDEISTEQKEQEKQIFLKQMEDDKKSPEIKEKIVEGKLKKFFAERCLLEMSFVKEPKITVQGYLEKSAKESGLSKVSLKTMKRIEIGKA